MTRIAKEFIGTVVAEQLIGSPSAMNDVTACTATDDRDQRGIIPNIVVASTAVDYQSLKWHVSTSNEGHLDSGNSRYSLIVPEKMIMIPMESTTAIIMMIT